MTANKRDQLWTLNNRVWATFTFLRDLLKHTIVYVHCCPEAVSFVWLHFHCVCLISVSVYIHLFCTTIYRWPNKVVYFTKIID